MTLPLSNSFYNPRILFVGLKYDYGDAQRGYSYEYVNFFQALANMKNVSAILFPFDEIMRLKGRDTMNKQLLETVQGTRPDICFFFLFTDEIKQETIRTISDSGKTITINWFADDHWRFEVFSQWWAPLFHWIVTTDKEAPEKYYRTGYGNVIRSQWAFNHFLHPHLDGAYEYDVTFVGQVHSSRKRFIRALDQSGIHPQCWGRGWPNGRLSQGEMQALYSKSKINLNFTESSPGFRLKTITKALLTRRADNSFRVNTPKELSLYLLTLFTDRRTQIKGRNFEIPGTGGFLLTQYATGIEEYFVPDQEIATFKTQDELCEKIHYFLSHDSERETIRAAGHERALKEHTFQRRFEDIFRIVLKK